MRGGHRGGGNLDTSYCLGSRMSLVLRFSALDEALVCRRCTFCSLQEAGQIRIGLCMGRILGHASKRVGCEEGSC